MSLVDVGITTWFSVAPSDLEDYPLTNVVKEENFRTDIYFNNHFQILF